MENITLKNSANEDVVFVVRRQPGANLSAVLQPSAAGLETRTQMPRIEVSTRLAGGGSQPVVTVNVPYGGSATNGLYVRSGQVTQVLRGTQPDAAPDRAVLDCEAFTSQLAAHSSIRALFRDGDLA